MDGDPPSQAVRVVAARLPATADTVPRVRRDTVRTLTTWSVPPATVESAALAVTELSTNAVAAGTGDDLAIRLSAALDHILIEVWNHGTATQPRLQQPASDDENGRGLLLVDAVAESWGTYAAPSGGTVVWARIAGGTLVIHPSRDDTPLTARTSSAVPPPDRPVVFRTDEMTLRRVAERLRALDTWHDNPALASASLAAAAPRPPGARTVGAPSVARTPMPC
jgi:anti-sigma regulatory factor (Ser/Thr protein kinase)